MGLIAESCNALLAEMDQLCWFDLWQPGLALRDSRLEYGTLAEEQFYVVILRLSLL